MRGRRLVAVDIENVVGGAVHTRAEAVWARTQIEEVMDLNGDEHVVIGTSHIGLLESGLAWSGKRYVVRSGCDGADLALLDVLEQEHIAERFDEVFLVSGDGIFTDVVVDLISAGVKVSVFAHRETLSKRLGLAATEVVWLTKSQAHIGFAA